MLTTSLIAIAAAALAAPELGASREMGALIAAVAWYGAEAVLTAGAGWPLGFWFLPAAIARDLLLPWLWVQGLASDRFEWRGAALTVADLAHVEAGRSG